MNGSVSLAQHEFDPGYSGLSVRCNALVADVEGYGTTCDLPRDQHESAHEADDGGAA